MPNVRCAGIKQNYPGTALVTAPASVSMGACSMHQPPLPCSATTPMTDAKTQWLSTLLGLGGSGLVSFSGRLPVSLSTLVLGRRSCSPRSLGLSAGIDGCFLSCSFFGSFMLYVFLRMNK